MVNYEIQLVFVPVADIARSVEFYGTTLGWPVDYDQVVSDDLHFVQVTPPGSACSIAFGTGLGITMEPGTLKALQVVVASADEAYEDLRSRGVAVDPPFDLAWGRFVNFADPDGNTWAVQELPKRG